MSLLNSASANMVGCVAAAVSACSGVQPGSGDTLRGVQLFSTLCPSNATALWGGGGVAIAQGASASIRFAPPPGCPDAYCDLPFEHLRLALQALPPFFMPPTRGSALVELTIRIGRYFLFPDGDPNGAPGSIAFVHFNDSAVVRTSLRVPAIPTVFRIDMRSARYYGNGVGYVRSSSSSGPPWVPFFIPGEMKLVVEASTITYDWQYASASVPQAYIDATPPQIMWLLAPACAGAGRPWLGSTSDGSAPPPPERNTPCSALLGLDVMPGCPATAPCDLLREQPSAQLWRRELQGAEEEEDEGRSDSQLAEGDVKAVTGQARRLTAPSQRWWPEVCLDGGNKDRWGCTTLLPAVELAAGVPCNEVNVAYEGSTGTGTGTGPGSSTGTRSGDSSGSDSPSTDSGSWFVEPAAAPTTRRLSIISDDDHGRDSDDDGWEDSQHDIPSSGGDSGWASATVTESDAGADVATLPDAVVEPEPDSQSSISYESFERQRRLTAEGDACCHVSTTGYRCPRCPNSAGGVNPLNPFPGADNTLTASYIAPAADAVCVVDSNSSDASVQAEALLVFPAPCTRCTLVFSEAWLALASSCSSTQRITATLGYYVGPFWRARVWPRSDYACVRNAFIPAAPGCETALFVPRNVSAYSPLSLACNSAGTGSGVRISIGDSMDVEGWGAISPPWLALRLQSSSGCFAIGGGLQPFFGGDAGPTCPHNHFHGYGGVPITPVGLLLPVSDGLLDIGPGWLPSPATPGLFMPAAVEPWANSSCPSQTPRPSASCSRTPVPHSDTAPSSSLSASPSPTHSSWSGSGGGGGGNTGSGGGSSIDDTWGAHDKTDTCTCRISGMPPMGALTPISGIITGLPYPPQQCSLRVFICVNGNPNQWWSKPGLGPAAVVPVQQDGSFYLPGWATGAGDAAFTNIRICVIPPGSHDLQDTLGGPVPDSVFQVAIGVATFTRDGVAVGTVNTGGGGGGGGGGLLLTPSVSPSTTPSHSRSRSHSPTHTRTHSRSATATATHSTGWKAPWFLTGEGPYGPTSADWWDATGGGPSYEVEVDGAGGVSAGAAVGIAVAAVIVFAVLVLVVIALWRRPRRQRRGGAAALRVDCQLRKPESVCSQGQLVPEQKMQLQLQEWHKKQPLKGLLPTEQRQVQRLLRLLLKLRQQEVQRRMRLAQRQVALLQAQLLRLQVEAPSCWCQPQRQLQVQLFAIGRATLAGPAPHKAALACKKSQMQVRPWKHSSGGCWAEYGSSSVRSHARQQQKAQVQVQWPMQ